MHTESFIAGKDASLESTIRTMQAKLAARGFTLDESSWLHEIDSIWSVHVKDRDCPMLFANGKGATELAARASALGEFFERHIKYRIISEGLCLPEVPEAVIARFPGIAAGIAGLRAAGFGIVVRDASLGA